MFDRRQILKAALFVAAAPIIVRSGSIMKVRALPADWLGERGKTLAEQYGNGVIMAVYMGPTKTLPNGEVAYVGDILYGETSKWKQLVWRTEALLFDIGLGK